MCVYCMIGDWQFQRNPPWQPGPNNPWHHLIPQPTTPLTPAYVPWGLDQLKEFQDLLRRVKELEDKIGCPCEPNKADYLGLLSARIEQLEKQLEIKDSK